MGAEWVLSLDPVRLCWPKMAIEEKCQTCERRFRRKASPQKAESMPLTTFTLELVHMDYLSLEPDLHDTIEISWSLPVILLSLHRYLPVVSLVIFTAI